MIGFKEFQLYEKLLDAEDKLYHVSTGTEMNALHKKLGDLRGIHSKKHGTFVWRAYDATHDEMANRIEKKRGITLQRSSHERFDPSSDTHSFYVDRDPGHGRVAAWSHHNSNSHKGDEHERVAAAAHEDLKKRLSSGRVHVERPTIDDEEEDKKGWY